MAIISYIPPAALASMTLVTLNDADTGTDLAPTATAFAASNLPGGTVVWQLSVSAPTASTVRWSAVATPVSGSPADVGGTVPGDVLTPQGYYAGLADLTAMYGTNNLAAWCNNGGTQGTINVATVQAALDYADQAIDGYMSGGIVATPLPKSGLLAKYAATIAGEWLYRKTGNLEKVATAFGGERLVNVYRFDVNEVYANLLNYRCGKRPVPGATYVADPSPSAAAVTGGYGANGSGWPIWSPYGGGY